MKILITGATGFIGANLTRKLLEKQDIEVYITARSYSNFWRLEEVKNQIKGIYFVDLADRAQVFELIENIQPNCICHLAAFGVFPSQIKNKKEIIKTNLTATVNLLDAAVEYKTKKFINTGSASEYGIIDRAVKEEDRCEPFDLYGITKLAATNYCSLIGKSMQYPVCTLRLFTVFGKYEDPTRLYPSILEALRRNERPKLSNPTIIRDFIEVGKVVSIYMKMLEVEFNPGAIYNVGSGRQQTIREFYLMIANQMGKSEIEPIWGQVPQRKSEPKIWANIDRLRALIGYDVLGVGTNNIEIE